MNQKNTGDKVTGMNCNHTREQFPDYLTGDLEPSVTEIVREHVADCTSCRTELEELTTTWTHLGVLPEEQPGPNLRKNFYAMLESYNEGMNRESAFKRFLNWITGVNAGQRRPVYQMAFTVIFLLVGFAAGLFFSPGAAESEPVPNGETEVARLRGEVRQMRQQLAISLMDQSSPSQRIKGITWTSTVSNPAPQTLDALLNTLNSDPNVNVRLSAVDALYLFAGNPKVKEGVIESLPHQKSPMVQVALIDLMVEMREKKAMDALKELIKNDKLNPTVKERAKLVIKSQI